PDAPLVCGVPGAGGGHGIHSPVLENGVAGVGGKVPVAFGSSHVEPRPAGSQARLCRRRATRAAADCWGTGAELCAGPGTAAMAHAGAREAPGAARPRAASQRSGGISGADPDQTVLRIE